LLPSKNSRHVEKKKSIPLHDNDLIIIYQSTFKLFSPLSCASLASGLSLSLE
jgi:hypothetical protein